MKFDSRWIYVAVFLTIGIPILAPIGLPVLITPTTRGMFDAIQNLPSGSIMYLGIDFLAVSQPELLPMSTAVYKQAISRPISIVMACFSTTDCPLFTQRIIQQIGYGSKKYGEDIVFLGYFPGLETPIAAFAKDVRSVVSVDAFGTPISQLALMNRVKSAADFNLWVVMTSGDYVPYLRQVQSPYHIKMAFGTSSPEYPTGLVYYQSGQIVGLLNGLRGAAEYELLIHSPGSAAGGMDAQSVTQLFIIVAVIGANALYFSRRKKK